MAYLIAPQDSGVECIGTSLCCPISDDFVDVASSGSTNKEVDVPRPFSLQPGHYFRALVVSIPSILELVVVNPQEDPRWYGQRVDSNVKQGRSLAASKLEESRG